MIYIKVFVSIYNLIRKNLHVFVYVLLCIYLSWPWPYRFATHFPHIKGKHILDNLLEKTASNITHIAGKQCIYNDIIEENTILYKAPYTEEILGPNEIQPGGEYIPKDCVPRFSTAIIVSYRNREDHLRRFTTYMHNFLRKQKIHYRIFIIEQSDTKPFNRAKLFNIGAVVALKNTFPCLIFHDIDLLPMNIGNIYACSRMPRHMSSSIDIFRFNLPYKEIMGGVGAIDSNKFKIINGFSNLYEGWGGEDDDFYRRLSIKGYVLDRFEAAYSRYVMLKHAKEVPSENRLDILNEWDKRLDNDGLNSLQYTEKSVIIDPLYTNVIVET